MNVRAGRDGEWKRSCEERERKTQTSGLREGHRERSIFHVFFFLLTMHCDHLQEKGRNEDGQRTWTYSGVRIRLYRAQLSGSRMSDARNFFKGYPGTCKFQEGFRWISIQTDKRTLPLRYVDNRDEKCGLNSGELLMSTVKKTTAQSLAFQHVLKDTHKNAEQEPETPSSSPYTSPQL